MEIKLESQQVGDVLILTVLDRRIRYEQSNDFDNQVRKALDESKGNNLVLNLEEVEYMTTDTLGKLIVIHKRITEKKGQLKLVLAHKPVIHAFKITKLHKILQIYSSLPRALKAD